MSTHRYPVPGQAISAGVISDYIAASNDGRIGDAVACFAQNALVRDNGHDHWGIDAIRRLITETTESSQPKMEVISATVDGEVHRVTCEISGAFPGSPVELEFKFVINGGKISSLDIE